MRDVLALPQDIHAVVWSSLTLVDILHLRQTCSALSRYISSDKQLWTRIFDQYVKARSLPLPYNLRGIEDASAYDIESLIKHALALERKYADPGNLSFRKIGNRLGLGVTWLKLLRGRWCLIASSNTEKSELSVWEIPTRGDLRLAGRVYLEGPVIDGLVDETAEYLHCALTIGTSKPYILVLSISSLQGSVTFHPLAELPGASHVRFLDERYIGFAVRNGDDTYPYIAEWKQGQHHKLILPNTNPLSPLPIEPCIAMMVKNNHVLTLNRDGVNILTMTGAGNQIDTTHVVFLALQERAYGGYFLDILDDIESAPSDMFIRLYYQNFDTEFLQATITCSTDSGETGMWILEEKMIVNPPDVFRSTVLARHSLGLSGRRIFCVTSRVRRPVLLPNLFIGSIRSKNTDEDAFPSFEEYHSVPRVGFPLSHLITSLAFDDGNGLLLVGTMSGDVRIASFVEEEFVTHNSTWTDLPEVQMEIPTVESRNISGIPIQSDLPTFYDVRICKESLDSSPPDLLQKVIQSWCDPLLGPLPFSDWSNDWSRFERVSEWIFPYPRWGTAERHYYEAPTTTARVRIQSLGEIIPVMYNTQNHRRVVFRIGQRMFYCRMQSETSDDEENEDFDDEPDIILGVLPCTYDQLFSAPFSVIGHVSDHSTQRNLTDLSIERSCDAQSSAAAAVFSIREYQKSHGMIVADDATMGQWSIEEWEDMFWKCKRS